MSAKNKGRERLRAGIPRDLQALPLVLTFLALVINNFPLPQLISDTALKWCDVTRHLWISAFDALPSWMDMSITARQSDAVTLFAVLGFPLVWTFGAPRLARKFSGWLLRVFNIDTQKLPLSSIFTGLAGTRGPSTARVFSICASAGIVALILIDSVVRMKSLSLVGYMLGAILVLVIVVSVMGAISGGDPVAAIGCLIVFTSVPLAIAIMCVFTLPLTNTISTPLIVPDPS